MNIMPFHQEFEVAKENRFLVFEWIRGSEFSSGLSGGYKDMLTGTPEQGHIVAGPELQVEWVSMPWTWWLTSISMSIINVLCYSHLYNNFFQRVVVGIKWSRIYHKIGNQNC